MNRDISNILMEIPAVSLISIGVSGKAYLRGDAIKVISFARQNIVPVLGGDVYYKSTIDNAIHLTYDNWYCNREELESLKEYADRSCDVAEHFITNYNCPKGYDAIFYIVLAEEWLTT